jgi:hypothetical protein
MTQEAFHQYYEAESDQVFEVLSRLTEDECLRIITDVAERRFKIWEGGENYQIWRVLKEKGTRKSIWPLFEIVRNLENSYLVRYHACEALFCIAGLKDENFKKEVQLGFNAENIRVDRADVMKKLEGLLA